jgi:cytochrome P450
MLINDERGLIFVSPQAYADQANWHAVAAELRRDAPVLRVEAEGYTPFYALTRHADVFEVSRRSDIFFNTRNSVLGPDANFEFIHSIGIDPKTLIHMDGTEHRDHRHVTNDWFKPAAVKKRQGDIDAIADEFVDKLADLGGACDFAQDIAVPYTLRVIMSIFGVPREDERTMLELTQGIFGAADPEYLGDFSDPLEFLTATIGRFDEYFEALTADRRAHPTDDLATVIANGEIDGCPMERHARLWYYIIVATAGHDTTSYALSGGMEALLRRPDQLAALAADPSLATNAAEEMIRWTSPVRAFLRYAQEDTEVDGVPIAAGERVLLSYPSANRDDAVFVDPTHFDITRPDADKLISFGLGVHYCLGSQFARREVRTMLPKLLARVRTIELAAEPEWAEANFVGGVKHLPVRFTLR